MTPQERRTRFFELHAGEQVFVMPNPWDVGSAKLLAGAGFLRERAARLEAEARAGALLAEVERVRASLEAYRAHLDRVRERVGDLQRELETLAELVASEPISPPDAAPGAPDPEEAGIPAPPAAEASPEP